MDFPSTDEEFRRAIKALDASTHAIERQGRAFNSQADYLRNLRANEDTANERRNTHASYLSQRQAAELQYITFANEQLLDSLRAELQFENEPVAKEVKTVHTVVSNVLTADDRALAALNVLTSGSADSTVNTGDAARRLAELTSGLQHFRVQAVKDRLDCTYLRCLDDQPSPPEGEVLPHPSPATVTDVQNDLGSLYAEIEDVVTMTVRHEHASPIETALHEIDCVREREEERVAEQVHGRLSSLTESLEQLSSRLENLHTQRTALRTLLSRIEILDQRHQRPLSRNPIRPIPATNTNTSGTSLPTGLSTLLEHLSLPPQHDQHNPPSHAQLHTDMQAHTTKLQTLSDEHLAAVLTASEKAATARREVLSAVTSHQTSKASEESEQNIAELEAAVNAARLQMERRNETR